MNTKQLITKFEAYLLTHKRVAINTFAAYKQDLKQFVLFLDKKKLELKVINPEYLKQFLHHLHEKKLTARSIARKISTLKALFAYFCNQGLLKNDPTKELVMPKLEKKLPNYLSEQEVEILFEVAEQDKTEQGIRNKVMLYVLYVSGMRVSELTQLKVSALQFDTGTVCVEGKGSKQRLIPLPQPILALLQEYLERTLKIGMERKNGIRTDWLFPISYAGKIKPISRQAFWNILKRIWKKADINRAISPHKLRHSFATHMLKKGANLRSLQLLLGHENLSTVQIYTHVETSYVRKVYDKKHPRS